MQILLDDLDFPVHFLWVECVPCQSTFENSANVVVYTPSFQAVAYAALRFLIIHRGIWIHWRTVLYLYFRGRLDGGQVNLVEGLPSRVEPFDWIRMMFDEGGFLMRRTDSYSKFEMPWSRIKTTPDLA